MIKIVLQQSLRPYFSADENGFKAVMTLSGKTIRGSRARKIVLRFCRGEQVHFAKIHIKIVWKKIIKYLLLFGIPMTRVQREVWAIKHLQNLGINTPKISAYGHKKIAYIIINEFVITEELTHHISLTEFCLNWQQQPPPFALKKQLIIKVAELLSCLHINKIKFGDFKLGHIYLDEQEMKQGNIVLSVLDLEYVRLSISKSKLAYDIGHLYESCFKIGLTKRDILRFIRSYSQNPLGEALKVEKQFWQQVKKQAIRYFYRINRNNSVLTKLPM